MLPMNLEVAALVFVVIFLAELPDKSMFASLIMASRYNAFYVWLGAALAFLIHVLIAVLAGHIMTLLPHKVLETIIAVLFLGGAAMILFGRHGLEGEHKPHPISDKAAHSHWKVFALAFTVIFLGEWGDITQIATANYAAKYHSVISVAVGATLGLWVVSALAIIFGSRMISMIHPKIISRVTGSILLIFGIFSLISVFR